VLIIVVKRLDDEFLKEMGDVKPIKQEQRVRLQKSADTNSASAEFRRRAAQQESAASKDPLVDAEVPMVEANAILAFQRPGVQHGVYRQLRLGKYTIEARLDLHRMKLEEARLAVYQFIRDCISHDIRCAMITHGKGEGRKTPALIKSHVAHWLPQITEVLAFHSAQKHHGGSGATYVMLKKSDKKRQENLERHQKRFR
jgi:DNA-nicking Smr family endonuclease